MSENNEPSTGVGIPIEVLVNYLTDLHRQLDSIAFNIRTNITNLQGETKNASSTKE
jgi:hypothetical protein